MDIPSINAMDPGMSAQMSTRLKSEESRVNSFESVLEDAVKEKDNAKLKEACQSFESYFLQIMFREMRKTIGSDEGILPKSQAEEIFTDMLDEENSINISKGQGIGLAQMMYEQMSKNL